jgi:hypothetical protein
MKCLKKEIIFNYINGELSKEDFLTVKNHLASCMKCQAIHDKHKAKIELIRKNLDELEPAIVPEHVFIKPMRHEKRKVRQFINGITDVKFVPRFVNWKRLIVVPVLLIFILLLFISKDKSKLYNEVETQRIFFSAENYFDEDPKKDWNEKSLHITIINKQENTIELIRSSINKENISREVLKVNSLIGY